MRIIRSIAELEKIAGPLVLAAGTFDGLHLGHQALIRRAMEEAARVGGTSVVMTFDRHPASVTRPEHAPKLLTRNTTKLALLEAMGVPVVLLLEFNQSLASILAEEFIRSLADSAKPLHEICVGSQWSFGYRGEGNVNSLKNLGLELGFSVAEIAPVKITGRAISSTRIREAVSKGDFAEAAACLGRDFLLNGTVVTGAGLGVKIGFPTANLDVSGMQLPPDGVYAVNILLRSEKHPGVANIGIRPTVDSTAADRTVEIHLFQFSENIVDAKLEVEFFRFLRSERKFPDLAALSAQIESDCAQAKKFLATA